MKSAFTIYIFLTAFWSTAQMLDNTHASAFEGRPDFVRTFIMTHGIQTIRGNFSTKADRDEIRPNNDATFYKFNKFGELTFEYKAVYKDTLFTLYVYDERSNVIIKRTADKYGFQSFHYTYDNRNRVVSITTRQEQNTGQDIFVHIPDKEYQKTTEQFQYTDLDGLNYKKSYLNSAGIVYKEEFFYFDEKNRLIKQEGYQKSGSGKTILELFYNEKGQLIEKKSSSTVMGNYSNRYTYEYDEFGNILSMKYFDADEYKTEFQYVYDSSTHYLKALIMRDAKTNLMTIVKYDLYTFY